MNSGTKNVLEFLGTKTQKNDGTKMEQMEQMEQSWNRKTHEKVTTAHEKTRICGFSSQFLQMICSILFHAVPCLTCGNTDFGTWNKEPSINKNIKI